MATVAVLNTDAQLSAKTLAVNQGAGTVTGLWTFDRDPSAPFAVAASSGVVANLDADKVDGVEGTSFLRSDAADTKDTGDLTFNDNIKQTYGTGGDADQYYDGTDLVIDPAVVGTGRLLILGTSGSTAVELASGTSAMELRIREPSGGGTSYTGFTAPALAGNVVYTLPTADGAADQTLTTDGSAVLSWATAAAVLEVQVFS